MTVSRLAYGSGGRRQQETVSRGVTAGFANGVADTDVAQANRGLLRVEEAAEWLGLSRTKAYELVYRGALPSVTIGRSRRVTPYYRARRGQNKPQGRQKRGSESIMNERRWLTRFASEVS